MVDDLGTRDSSPKTIDHSGSPKGTTEWVMFDDSDAEGNDLLSNDGGTIFDRFSSSDADKKRVRHLIKDLGGDVTFKPLNEEEFDELLIKWKRVASSMMYSPAELKEVIILKTTSVNQDLIARRGLMNLPFQEFVDAFAAHLFPFSDEINLVCARLQHQHRKADALQVIEDFLLLRSRFKALCRRWGQSRRYRCLDYGYCLLRKVDKDIELQIRSDVSFKHLSLQDLVERIKAIHRARQLVRDAEPAVHAISPTPPQEHDAAHHSDRLCKWCDSKEHISFRCPTKPVCPNCNKRGHFQDDCWQITRKGPLGTRQAFLRREPGGSFKLSIDDIKNNRELLRTLANMYNEKFEKESRYYHNAKQRRERKRDGTAHQSHRDDRDDEAMFSDEPLGAGRVETAESLLVGAQEVNRRNCRHVQLPVAGRLLPFMVDTGAEINIFPEPLLKNLDVQTQSSVTGLESPLQVKGVGGYSKCDSQVRITTSVNGQVVELDFYVLPTPMMKYPMLGLPALQQLGAAVDLASERLATHHGDLPLVQDPDLVECDSRVSALQEAEESFTLSQIEERINPSLSVSQRQDILKLLTAYDSTWTATKVGRCKVLEHRIDTGDSKPIKQGTRRYSPEQKQEIQRQVQDLLAAGAIEESDSPWRSQIVMVPKKTGEWRMCVDYRALNDVTVPDTFPLPIIEDLHDQLGGVEHVITLDLKAGFHQIKIKEEDKPKTAFATPTGLYQFRVMPFGLINAPATFQRMTTKLLEDRLGSGCLVYIDDIVIYGSSWPSLMSNFEWVLQRLRDHEVFLNIRKSHFGLSEFEYLGVTIRDGKIYPSKKSIATIQGLSPPEDVNGVRRLLGLVGYLRKFIPDFAALVKPIQELITAEEFVWSDECQRKFEDIKRLLTTSQPSLCLPRSGLPFYLDTDASTYAIAGVLQQREGDTTYVLQFASKKLTTAEAKWPIYELEAYAIVWSIFHFAHYLRGKEFIVRTDHQSLKWLWNTEKSRIARWAMFLQEFQFKVVYRAGRDQQHVDIFTRDIQFSKLDEDIDARWVLASHTDVRPYMLTLNETFPSPDDFVTAFNGEQEHPPQHTLQNGLPIVNNRVYVPEPLRRRILFYFHFSRVGAHQGIQRSYNRLAKYFWWNNMFNDVRNFAKQCLTCIRRRHTAIDFVRGNLLSTGLFEIVACDTVGPIWFQKRQYYLFTCIDHLSKFAIAVPLNTVRAVDLWEAFYCNWLSLLGSPRNLLSDNAFRATEFQERCQGLGINCLFCSAYYPQGNSVVEAFHQYLNRSISSFASTTPWSFPEIVASAMMAYRSTPHPTTGESPYRIVTGADLVLPHFQQWHRFENLIQDVVPRLRLLDTFRQDALDHTLRTISRRRTPTTKEIKVGDTVVMLLRGKLLATLQERFGSSKLVPNWSEPCRVTEIKGHKVVAQSIWHKDLVYESPLSEVLKVTHSPTDLRTLTAQEINADRTQHIPLGTNPRHRANPYDQRPRAARSVRKTTEKPPRTPAGRGRTSPDADAGENTNEARFHFALVRRA